MVMTSSDGAAVVLDGGGDNECGVSDTVAPVGGGGWSAPARSVGSGRRGAAASAGADAGEKVPVWPVLSAGTSCTPSLRFPRAPVTVGK
jgi:hypothetical protein